MHATFDDSLVTGNNLIDSQHMELIGKINKLVDCCEEGRGKIEAIKMLDYLAEYTEFHFSAEEDLQEKINYPAADSKCTYITDTVKILRPLVQLQNL